MIVNSGLIGSLGLMALSMLGISLLWFEEGTARKASEFFAFPVILVMAFYMLSVPSTASTFTMSLSSNTLYQNTNSSPLGIYVTTHSAPLMGYLGNSTNLIKVIDMRGGSVTITGIVYSIAGYNMSSYVLVGPDDYYKFNFTNATFVGQYGD